MKHILNSMVIAAAAAVPAMSAHAAALVLPSANEMSTGVYGDFYVYSLELLDKCGAANDLRCKPYVAAQYPAPGNTNFIGNQLLIYKNASGNTQSNYQDGAPFASGTQLTTGVDEPFDSATGVGSTFDTSNANEPNGQDPALTPAPGDYGCLTTFTADFAGDRCGTFEAKLSSVRDWLTAQGGKDILFMFGNNQVGSSLDQTQFFWAQIKLTDASGNLVDLNGALPGGTRCWELNSTVGTVGNPTTGCSAGSPTFDPVQANWTPLKSGDFVGTGGAFCVDKVTGEGYIPQTGIPGNDGDCSVGGLDTNNVAHTSGYFIDNNLGQNSAEFASFLPELNANLEAWANAGYFMSIDFKARNLNDGGDQLWIQAANIGGQAPEPGSLALVGLALAGTVLMRRRAKV